MTRPPAPHLPLQGDERTQLTAFLDFYRGALIDRAYGLSDEQLQVAHPPATLTLSRLMGHMAMVEATWFLERFSGLPPTEPWASLDWDADFDAEMTLAQTWSGEELVARLNESIGKSQDVVAATESLDQLSVNGHPATGEKWDLRWILIHMIEEYARHCGHADLIREAIDGDVLR